MAGRSLRTARVLGGTVVRQVSSDIGRVPLVIRMSAPGLRNALGQYAPREGMAQLDAVRVNTALALQLQQHVVDIVGSFNRRPSTGRLKRAMADRRNIFVSDNGQSWGVGVPTFLNKSVARYWRTIDEGSAETFSRGGFAGTKIYPMVFPKRAALSSFLAWHTGVTPDNKPAGRGGAPNPRGKIWAVKEATGLDFEARYPGYEPIIVKREIEPHHYFEQAFQEMLPQIRSQRALKVALDHAWRGPGV